jgi:hypothetical protein
LLIAAQFASRTKETLLLSCNFQIRFRTKGLAHALLHRT